MGWHPVTAAGIPAVDPEGAATTVQAALDALAVTSSTWAARGTYTGTSDAAGRVAWETSGPNGVDWSALTRCSLATDLLPDLAAWWHVSLYAQIVVSDGDGPMNAPAGALWQATIGIPQSGYEAVATGWAHTDNPIDGNTVQLTSASGLVLAGPDGLGPGTDAAARVTGQVLGLDPDLSVAVDLWVYAAHAAPAGAFT